MLVRKLRRIPHYRFTVDGYVKKHSNYIVDSDINKFKKYLLDVGFNTYGVTTFLLVL